MGRTAALFWKNNVALCFRGPAAFRGCTRRAVWSWVERKAKPAAFGASRGQRGESPGERCFRSRCFCLVGACCSRQGSRESAKRWDRLLWYRLLTGDSQLFQSAFFWLFCRRRGVELCFERLGYRRRDFSRPPWLSPQLSPPSCLTWALRGRSRVGEMRKSRPYGDSRLALVKRLALGEWRAERGRGGRLHCWTPGASAPGACGMGWGGLLILTSHPNYRRFLFIRL